MNTSEALHIIARNFPHCAAFENTSFLGRLHEEETWSHAEYRLLEDGLIQLSAGATTPRELYQRIFRIFSSGFACFGHHVDPNDLLQIKNINGDEFYVLRERFQNLFEGFFSRDMSTVLDDRKQ